MEAARPSGASADLEKGPHFSEADLGEGEVGGAPAWEMIAEGRYMPRRIRGSCRGRALG